MLKIGCVASLTMLMWQRFPFLVLTMRQRVMGSADS